MKSFQAQTHYEVLEISVGASTEEIRAAYARLSRLYADEQVALYGLVDPERARMLGERLKQAVEVLTDDAQRDAYDAKIGLPPRELPESPKPAPPVGAVTPAASAGVTTGAWSQGFAWVTSAPAAPPSVPSANVYSVPVGSAAATPAPAPVEPPRPSQPARAPAHDAHHAASPRATFFTPRHDFAEDAPAPERVPEETAASVAATALSEASALEPSSQPTREPPASSAEGRTRASAAGAVEATSSVTGGSVTPPADARAGATAIEHPAEDRSGVAAAERGAAGGHAATSKSEAPAEVADRGVEAGTAAAERAASPEAEAATAGVGAPDRVGGMEAERKPAESAAPPKLDAPAEARAPTEAGPLEESAPPDAGGKAAASVVAEAAAEPPVPRLSDDAEVSIVPARATPREYRAEPRPKPYEVPAGVEFNGDLLRQVRMARGLSLLQLSERTRISVRHLENVEGDRYEALPAPVYLRGILMSLARELGLDGLRVSRSYLCFVEAHRSKG